MRQAVVVIHGIGEQRPLSTIRGFLTAITDGLVRSKPDRLSESFELRRFTLPETRSLPLTDVYELYWAHHIRIRSEGVKLLRRLHEARSYSRIVVVGHSLGSVIGYDVLRHLWDELRWPSFERATGSPRPPRSRRRSKRSSIRRREPRPEPRSRRSSRLSTGSGASSGAWEYPGS